MNQLNLVLKFRLEGDTQVQARGVSRIEIDGRGGMVLYNAQGRPVEQVRLNDLKAFDIQRVNVFGPSLAEYAVA
jgi:hypothetical protein